MCLLVSSFKACIATCIAKSEFIANPIFLQKCSAPLFPVSYILAFPPFAGNLAIHPFTPPYSRISPACRHQSSLTGSADEEEDDPPPLPIANVFKSEGGRANGGGRTHGCTTVPTVFDPLL